MNHTPRTAIALASMAMMFTLVMPQLALAAAAPAPAPAPAPATEDVLPLKKLKEAIDPKAGLGAADGAFPSDDPFKIANGIILVFFSIMGLVFTALMIYGGWNWMTAMGESEKVDKAKDTIVSALIGIIILIAAYAITVFVIGQIYTRAAATATRAAR